MQLLNISCIYAVQYPKVLYLYMRKKPYLLNGHNKVSVCLSVIKIVAEFNTFVNSFFHNSHIFFGSFSLFLYPIPKDTV